MSQFFHLNGLWHDDRIGKGCLCDGKAALRPHMSLMKDDTCLSWMLDLEGDIKASQEGIVSPLVPHGEL